MRPSQRLAQLGLALPSMLQPAFKYVPVVVHGDVAYVSGQLPRVDGEIRWTGSLGGSVSLEEGRAAAWACAVQALACLAGTLGTIDRVSRIIKLTGFVQSTPDFHQQPVVIDAASEVMLDVFGEDGRHARSAVGVAALPRDVPVELEVVAAIVRS
jgi:enamine deaminase RidA (YjgF/YER057c/UK114 family)